MSGTELERIWERLRSGRHAALVGMAMTSAPAGLRLIRVSCDVPPSTLGPLHDARRRLEAVLGEAPLLDQARERVLGGLRRRLLGEEPAGEIDAVLVELGNRLGDLDGPRSVLVFEAVEVADAPTLAVLRQIVLRPGWLRLPLLLLFRAPEPADAAGALLAALTLVEGAGAVARAAPDEAAPTGSSGPAERLHGLDPEPLTTLRAGATIGTGFEIELCAALLERSPLTTLLHLQAAIDHGVALEDRGEGRIHMPPALVEALRAGITPSLAKHWHRRLAELLGGDAPVAAPEPAPADRHAREAELLIAAESAASASPAADAPSPAVDAPQSAADAPQPADEPPPLATTEPPTEPQPSAEPPQPATAFTPRPQVRAPHVSHRHRRRPDAARAAAHLSALDEGDEAAARYIEAAREAADAGLGAQALSHGRRALALLEQLPPSDARRRLGVRALVELARIQWHSSVADAQMTLDTALGTARQAQAALRAGDPPALAAEVALVIAGIGHDRGDLRALEEALAALMAASQALMAAGDARGAAALLNDQAAINLRLGDHVRATHLLMSSRQVFEAAGDDDPVALRELGETHHLLARLPLHAPIRPGREGDALSMALDHALTAEKLLRRLGDARAVARVWETMGRIEIGKRRHERAGQRLAAALEVQRSLGDAIGLARTTAALADLLADRGQPRESLGLLASSVALNREKGSPLGLALNRRALERLRARLGGEHAGALAQVEAALAAAEQLLGRAPLPQGLADGPR